MRRAFEGAGRGFADDRAGATEGGRLADCGLPTEGGSPGAGEQVLVPQN